MNARLIALFVCIAIALAFACTEDASPDDTSMTTPEVSPTGGVFSPVSGSQAPANATPTPSTMPELRWHPRGIRTGVDLVDAVLEAVEEQDKQRFESLIHFISMPCITSPEGIIECNKGAANEVPTPVVGFERCEPSFIAADQPDDSSWLGYPFLTQPYVGLVAVLNLPSGTPDSPSATHRIVYSNSSSIVLDQQGITYLYTGGGEKTHDPSRPPCYVPPQTLIAEEVRRGASPLLASLTPLTSPPPAHRLGTRSGIRHVDDVIESAERRDINRFLGLFQFTGVPCTGDGSMTFDLVRCLDRATVGTLQQAVTLGVCNGLFYGLYDEQKENLDSTLVVTGTGMVGTGPPPTSGILYAVIGGNTIPYELQVPVSHVIVFTDGRVIGLGQHGVTYFEHPCTWDGRIVVAEMINRLGSLDYILPPR